MSNTAILKALDKAIDTLNQAKAIIAQSTETVKRGPGRPPKSASLVSAPVKKAGTRTLSPEARKKIADAQKKRWKKQKALKKAA